MIEQYLEKYPSWPKGLPWKGSRSLTRREGSNPSFSVLIFLKTKYFKKIKKVLDKQLRMR